MAWIRSSWKAFCAWYVRFVERQGFLIIVTVCVGVIAGTAAWTHNTAAPPPEPTPPAGDAASAAQLLQQSLAQAVQPTPAPTAAPVQWQPPVQTISVLRTFDASRLVRSGVTGLWQLHDAVDLRCETGEVIRAMADGTVFSVSDKGLSGACVIIDHGADVLAEYAGMAMPAGLRAGDPVQAGQTIGFAGNGVVDEANLEPHLHLRVTRSGKAVDPMTLMENGG